MAMLTLQQKPRLANASSREGLWWPGASRDGGRVAEEAGPTPQGLGGKCCWLEKKCLSQLIPPVKREPASSQACSALSDFSPHLL
jgi:hypothetical protein